MKNLLLLFITSITFSAMAQKVDKVTVTTTAALDYSMDRVKHAGKERKYGSRDLVINAADAKVILWQSVGNFASFEIFCKVTAVVKDGVTTISFVYPHNPKALCNYTQELKKIVNKLELPNQVVGKYVEEIE